MAAKGQITILGATGMLGSKLCQEALSKGYKVKALCRNEHHLNLEHDALQIIEGNYFDEEIVKQACEGAQTVISCIGPPQKGSVSRKEEQQYKDSFCDLLRHVENQQQRFIHISHTAAALPQEKIPGARKSLRFLMKLTARPTIRIKDFELLQLSKAIGVPWTSIRPPLIEQKCLGKFQSEEGKFIAVKVDLNQLIEFILKQINNRKWLRKAPTVGTKPAK